MANRGFNSVFVLMGVCICTQLDVVLLQTNPADWPGYYIENTKGDFAIYMQYNDGPHQLSVFLFYDTKTDSAKDFFTNQIPQTFLKDLYGCYNAVYLEFSTCSTSDLENGKLVCSKGEQKCTDNEYQICVMDALQEKFDMKATFLRCYFSGSSSDQCAEEIKLKSTDLQACVSGKTKLNVVQECAGFHSNFEKFREFKDYLHDNTIKYPDAIADFKGALCGVLKDVALKCTAACG